MNKLETFRLLISSFIERAQTTDVYELGDAIINESGISQDIMSGKDADDLARQENLEEFLSGMSAFVEERREEGRFDELFLQDYLQDVALSASVSSAFLLPRFRMERTSFLVSIPEIPGIPNFSIISDKVHTLRKFDGWSL